MRNRWRVRAVAAIVWAAAIAGAAPRAGTDVHGDGASCCAKPQPAKTRYQRTSAPYAPPDLRLVDQAGESVRLRDVLKDDGRPVALNFVFTTCNTICPVMSATFANLPREMGDRAGDVRMVSVTIDPEHDTPAVLRQYAARYAQGVDWRFLTGSLDQVVAAEKAFDAFAGSKMNHRPLTFLRAPGSNDWIRIDGLVSAAELAAEVRSLLPR